jgi:ABC-type transport system substrate-binding protein
METTWRTRRNARWHDGAPFTADDLLFSHRVQQDKEVAFFADTRYAGVENMEAPDPYTLVVAWKKPYIFADNLFDVSILPRHLLERPFNDSKATFVELPYWREEFVGTGPFKLRQWAHGSYAALSANDDYVLGRPRIDEIIVKFIPDPNTLLANLLAGEVDLTMGLGVSVDQALEVRTQWKNGRIEAPLAGWVVIFPQLLYTSPEIIRDARFRRALLHALDRQAMADAIQGGLSAIAHSYLSPNAPEYQDTEARIVRYEYDPRRAGQMIEELGYRKGPDGYFRDGASQRLEVQLRTLEGFDVHQKTVFPAADGWQRIGVATETMTVSRAQVNDQRFRGTFPSFELTRNPNDLNRLQIFYGSQARVPERNYLGANYMNLQDAEWDRLLDRLFATIPYPERTAVLGDIVHRISDEMLMMGLFYDIEPVFIASRVLNAMPRNSNVRSPQAWNAHEWDLGASS